MSITTRSLLPSTLAAASLIACLVACGDPPPAEDRDAGPVDAGPVDAGPNDAGPVDAGPDDAGPSCGATEQLCADPGGGARCVDPRTDPDHCGGCDAACEPLPHALPTCVASACVLTCESGWADCNGVGDDGCEVELAADDAHCGACGHACVAGTCGEGVCAVTWLYALGTTIGGSSGDPRQAVVEIRDLASGALAHTIALPGLEAQSLEVAPDGLVVYVAASTGEVLVVDAIAEEITARIPVPQVRDLVLSADGTQLYGVGAFGLHRIDLGSSEVTTIAIPDVGLAIALSPDGSTVVAAGWLPSGPSAAAYVVDTSTFAEAHRVPIVGSVAGCGTQPADVEVTPAGRALLWDRNCDALYQVDLATRAQVEGGTVTAGRDGALFGFGHSTLAYAPGSGRAYVSKESGELLTIDPAAATFTSRSDLGPEPTLVTLSHDQADVYVVTAMYPTVIARLALADGSVTPAVITLAHGLSTSDIVIADAR